MFDYPKFDAKMKTKILKDWNELFPGFKKNHPQVIRRRIGPIVLSIWYDLSRLKNEYDVRFTEFSLFRKDVMPWVNLETLPTLRFCLDWARHERGVYKTLAEEMRRDAFLPIEGPITLSQVIEAYRTHIQKEPLSMLHEGNLNALPLFYTWAGMEEKAFEMAEWVYQMHLKKIKDFQELTQKYFPINIEGWYQKLLEQISNPKLLHQIVEENVIRLKYDKIPYEDLIID